MWECGELFVCLIVHGFLKQFLVKDLKCVSSVHTGHCMLEISCALGRIEGKGVSQHSMQK